jgi:hypothetical protein
MERGGDSQPSIPGDLRDCSARDVRPRAPVSPWTVEKELGHGSRDMLEEVYGRVGDVRHRSEALEYRVEQHFDWQGGKWVPKSASSPFVHFAA